MMLKKNNEGPWDGAVIRDGAVIPHTLRSAHTPRVQDDTRSDSEWPPGPARALDQALRSAKLATIVSSQNISHLLAITGTSTRIGAT